MRPRLALAAALAGALAAPAFAQDAAAPEAEQPSADPGLGLVAGAQTDRQRTIQPGEDVVIATGRRLDGLSFEDYVYNFVGEISKPVSPNFGIARWDGEVCVGTMNLAGDPAQYVINRISDVAIDVGLETGAPGCNPQIMILFTEDGQGLASRLVEDQPRMFRPFGGAGGTTQGLHALEDFKNSDAPVRWWQITMPVGWDGSMAIDVPGDLFGPPTIRGANSLITSPTRDEMQAAYVIVDVTRTTELNWTQLADYLAVVTLAQIDPRANTAGYDTILNVFDDRTVRSLTPFDRSYLRSLYRFEQHRKPRTQPMVLANEMTRDQLRGEED